MLVQVQMMLYQWNLDIRGKDLAKASKDGREEEDDGNIINTKIKIKIQIEEALYVIIAISKGKWAMIGIGNKGNG